MHLKILLITTVCLLIVSCQKDAKNEAEYNPEVIKSYRNDRINTLKIDSLDAVFLIVKQKLQEVYDLSTLNVSIKKDSLSDSLLTEQLKSYFYKSDTIGIYSLLNEIDTMSIQRFSVYDVEQLQDSLINDSIGLATYKINIHYNGKSFVKSDQKSISYLLKRDEEKPDSLFQFYFYEWDLPSVNDTISSGVTQ